MNKGVIISVKKTYSVVLADGVFCRIHNKGGMAQGQTVIFTEDDICMKEASRLEYKFYAMIGVAASFLILFTMFYVWYMNYYSPYTIAMIDVNPSIQITLNKANKVIDSEVLNQDGVELGLLDLKGTNIENVVEMILKKSKEKGFVDELKETYLVVTIVSLKGDGSDVSREIEYKIREKTKGSKVLKSVNIAIFNSTKEKYKQAKEKEIPLVVYNLGDDVSVKEYNSVKEFFEDDKNINALRQEGNVIESSNKKIWEKVDNLLKEKQKGEVPDDVTLLIQDIRTSLMSDENNIEEIERVIEGRLLEIEEKRVRKEKERDYRDEEKENYGNLDDRREIDVPRIEVRKEEVGNRQEYEQGAKKQLERIEQERLKKQEQPNPR